MKEYVVIITAIFFFFSIKTYTKRQKKTKKNKAFNPIPYTDIYCLSCNSL